MRDKGITKALLYQSAKLDTFTFKHLICTSIQVHSLGRNPWNWHC